jgi:serine/threonine protein kinase
MSNVIQDVNIINGRYTLDKKIGHGSFGDVYIGYDKTEGTLVAIKIENADKRYILKHEYDIYQDIIANEHSKNLHIPKIYWYGVLPDERKVLVMQFLGNSLEYLFNRKCRGLFSIKTTLMIGIQALKLLHGLHECNYIHRDIKPDNFLICTATEPHVLYIIDLGLAKRYKSPENVHLKQSNGKSIVGTARYSSINSHLGIELSRRDDLESLGYMLIYFAKGSLPWQGLPADTKQDKYALIGKMKQEVPLTELCGGLPAVFQDYMSYVRSLEFKERPNYKYLYDILVACFKQQEFVWDAHDWEKRQ